MLHKEGDLDQAAVARKLQEELRVPVDQPKVSRWVKKVRDWFGISVSVGCRDGNPRRSAGGSRGVARE